MTFQEYNDFVGTTGTGAGEKDTKMIYYALGIAGEAGEYVDKVKKIWRNLGITSGKEVPEEQRIEMIKELGDQLWYITAAAKDLDSDLEEVAEINVAKLKDRQARGVVKSQGDNR